jgi:hypothetical protein
MLEFEVFLEVRFELSFSNQIAFHGAEASEMKLPNGEKAVVERVKVLDYLLNPAHPDNGGKAGFFMAMGFKADNWAALALVLRKLAVEAEVSERLETSHGMKYVVVGTLDTLSGKSSRVRTVWIVDRGSDIPRLVTAYPNKE